MRLISFCVGAGLMFVICDGAQAQVFIGGSGGTLAPAVAGTPPPPTSSGPTNTNTGSGTSAQVTNPAVGSNGGIGISGGSGNVSGHGISNSGVVVQKSQNVVTGAVTGGGMYSPTIVYEIVEQ
jgi:hypothetical protein